MLYDILIIGSGPAGITAGIYAKRANLKVAVFEKGAPGGQVLNTAEIENYPGFTKATGYELASAMFEHVLALDVEVIFEEVITVKDLGNKKQVVTPNQVFETKAVLVTSGAVPRVLEVPGEMDFASRGISWCAICDGPLYKDKKVVVIGGGNSAVEESLFLSNIAKHITIVQNLGHLTADPKAIQLLQKASNIDYIYHAQVLEFLGVDGLTGVKINTKEGERIIDAEGVFEYVGLVPVTNFLNELGVTNEAGYVIANEKMETKVPGIFSAGDVNVKQIRQVVTAVSDGAIAVQNIIKYLETIGE